jgi:two-component system, OmpR family, sensor kinase
MSRPGLRRRLLLVVLATVALVIAALVAGFNVLLVRTLDGDARDLVRSRAAAQVASLRIDQGHLSVGEAPDGRSSDAYVWVFAGGRPLERPNTGAAIDRAARGLAAGPAGFVDVARSDTRLYGTPVVAGGKRIGTVVAAVSLAPYEQTRRTALIASLVFGAVVLLLVGVAASWLLSASLRPVVRMTRQAAAWSERELDHRFALGPPHDELTELAATLDALLDRLAASLRRERRFSAELSHELRTPLARLLAESEIALARERQPREYRQVLELVHRNAGQLARTVEALVAAARYESGASRGSADAEAVAAEAAAACRGLAAERRIELKIAGPAHPLRVGVEAELAERVLQPVIENACRYGSSRVRVGIERRDSTVLYTVEDDGAGVDTDERERIFEPGARGSAGESNGNNGAGLGLPLARRLARSVSGDLVADPSESGGRFVIRLPGG